MGMDAIRLSIARHTRDFSTMLSFYRDVLALKIVESWDEPDNCGALLAAGKNLGDVMIEVIQLGHEAIPGVKPANIALSFEVKDVDAWHDHLVGKGVSIARGLENASWGHRSFGIDDPDGFRLWFYQDIGDC
jgi:uncharacterized glyoxalase superfamily protein PhnB